MKTCHSFTQRHANFTFIYLVFLHFNIHRHKFILQNKCAALLCFINPNYALYCKSHFMTGFHLAEIK